MVKIRGLATGIGSLPFRDPQEALRSVFRYTPQIPFWPQLPKRDIREGMVAQFSRNIPCLGINRQGVIFDPAEKDKKLEVFYERLIADDLAYFELGREYAVGFYAFLNHLKQIDLKNIEFLKCHVTGPFTFAASIKDEKGAALLHDSIFMQAITKGLGMKALWQIRQLEQFGKNIIIFLDEPYLGCFGSAYTPLNREEVVKGLREFSELIGSENVWIGVHCCGNTDWSIFTDVAKMRIINFDAFSFTEKLFLYADNLKDFLGRGGALCWGIVPTHELSGNETKEQLAERIDQGIGVLAKKGVNKGLLQERLLLSPSCGLGTIEEEKTVRILKLLYETSSKIRGI